MTSDVPVTADMTDVQVLAAVGEALYGTAWQTRMPPHLGMSRSLVYAVVGGERPLTAKARARLLALCEEEPARLADQLGDRLRLLVAAAAILRGR